METKYRDHINSFLDELCTTTRCFPRLLGKLTAKDLLNESDTAALELPTLSLFEKSKTLYEILLTKPNSYHKLMLSLKEAYQFEPVEILARKCCPIVQEIFVEGDLNEKDEDGDTVLFLAINSGGNMSHIKEIIALGGNPMVRDRYGRTVVHKTECRGNIEAMKYFISLGVDINAVDDRGNNVVLLAALSGRPKSELETIVGLGGDWKHKNKFGMSVFHLAAEGGNLEAMKYFISLGAEIKAVDDYGDNVVLFAAFSGRSREQLESIVGLGGDWKHNNKFGRSVLHSAAEGGNVEAIKYFISLGADIKAVDDDGDNVVHRAAFMGRSREELESIVGLGAEWKLKNKFGRSVLHHAAEGGNVDAIEFFISLGADIKVVDDDGDNVVLRAAYNRRSTEELESIVGLAGDWKHKNKFGRSVLHLAASGGNVEAMQYFLSLGESIDCKDDQNSTVLHMVAAADQNFKQTLEFLLEKNLDINAVTKYGNGLLSLAKSWGRSEMEIELIKHYLGKRSY